MPSSATVAMVPLTLTVASRLVVPVTVIGLVFTVASSAGCVTSRRRAAGTTGVGDGGAGVTGLAVAAGEGLAVAGGGAGAAVAVGAAVTGLGVAVWGLLVAVAGAGEGTLVAWVGAAVGMGVACSFWQSVRMSIIPARAAMAHIIARAFATALGELLRYPMVCLLLTDV